MCNTYTISPGEIFHTYSGPVQIDGFARMQNCFFGTRIYIDDRGNITPEDPDTAGQLFTKAEVLGFIHEQTGHNYKYAEMVGE